MTRAQVILGPILNPRPDGEVEFSADGAIACDNAGTIDYVGPAAGLPPALATGRLSRRTSHLLLPPFVDAHIHIPQHPIRGHFMDVVGANPEHGRLLAGLNRNVFPAEARCADRAVAEQVVADFAADTLAKGVVGGAAYMTVHAEATDVALSRLHPFWRVGLVLMEMNCPDYLRVDPASVIAEMESLADQFGERFIVTDRFAVAVGSDLRRRAARLAWDRDLMTQTHLNEQVREKQFVERTLYPDYASYTDVYRQDGLLDATAIVAHCIHMTEAEMGMLAPRQPFVAHCPTSNALLCSGIMPLDRIAGHGLEYAICTDVGASPTTSMLAEMAQFLKVHAGRSGAATPSEALFRATLAPALKLGIETGRFAIGAPLSFIEVRADGAPFAFADDAIRRGLLEMTRDHERGNYQAALDALQQGTLDCGSSLNLLEADVRDTARRLDDKVISVTLAGEEIWRRKV
ncbi:MAG TPA: amidohydrolase family protein [Tepidisphaeraceae bacterium]|nr:amidohydrolase family protein [Tepidisphaeraceae bacterium]